VAIGLVLLANAALLAWMLMRPAGVATPAQVPASVPVPVQAPVQAQPAPAQPLPAPAVAQAPAIATPPPATTTRELPPLPVAPLVEEPRVAPVNPADFQPALPPARLPPAPNADSAAIASDGGLPTAADLATIGVPELRLALHVYDQNPQTRYVLMNSQRLREGDVSSEGVRVERIDPNAVILSFRGTRFRLLPGS